VGAPLEPVEAVDPVGPSESVVADLPVDRVEPVESLRSLLHAPNTPIAMTATTSGARHVLLSMVST
jgi:hypothetical protein